MKEFFFAVALILSIGTCLAVFGAWVLGKIAPKWKFRSRAIIGTAASATLIVATFAILLKHDHSRPAQSTREDRDLIIPAPEPVPTNPNGSTGDENPAFRRLPDIEPDIERDPPHAETVPRPGFAFPRFPWPPPAPSGWVVIPNAVLLTKLGRIQLSTRGPATLGDVNIILRQALTFGGYWEGTYFSVPGGFALVARLERINLDGTPAQGEARFDTSYRPLQEFSVRSYLRALFLAPPGYYRVIAFVVSPVPFAATGAPITADTAGLWVEIGANALPQRLQDEMYSPNFNCTALIYEFEKRDAGSNPQERRPGRLPAEIHLSRSRLWEGLE